MPAPSSPQLLWKVPFFQLDLDFLLPSHQQMYTLHHHWVTTAPLLVPLDLFVKFPALVVIPAGGAGTRLWPLSWENHPKFLLDVTLQGCSLIQATWDRLLPHCGPEGLTVVAGPAHVKSIHEQLLDLLPRNVFCEPGPKGSMPGRNRPRCSDSRAV